MNGNTIKKAVTLAGFAALAGLGTMIGSTAATAATATPGASAAPAAIGGKTVAYVRAGVIYSSDGYNEVRLTEDEVNARPRFSPDGTKLTYLHNDTVWVMNADGSGKRQVSDRVAGGASWSPDGSWIAYAALSCTGGPGVFRVAADGPAGAVSQPLFPASCRDQAVPEVAYITEQATEQPTEQATEQPTEQAAEQAAEVKPGKLVDRLRTDDAVAWSPDGSKIAFRGGECESIADNCLSVGNVETGTERAIDYYGGGGSGTSGFGVVPAWSPDGQKVTWTTYTEDGTAVRVTEADADGGNRHQIGAADDREMVYAGRRTGVLTASHQGHSWVTAVDLATGARTPLHQGSQPTVQAR
ncbi:TolB family protein [Dactylosporangium sp. NPDC000521]|uniref:TolB family protein n=1 Tax=Dactylosporangium sp. NPDC000521 TaxID=3363975 RepID=UPI0036884FEB